MNFSPRLRQVLLILLQEEQVIPVKKLADEIKVSKRTVQRELEYTDSSLKKYGVSLQTKTGIGIWLDGSEEDKKKLLTVLQEEDVIDSGDKEERRKRLILEILKDRTPKKLYYYGNIFGVSEATISNDMEVIENWFHQFDLTIKRKQGYGVALEGSEKNYRFALRKFIDENIDSQIIKNLFNEKERTVYDIIGSKDGQNIYNLLNNDILKQVITCFHSIKDKRLQRLTENSYIGLILHVAIAINRIFQKEIIEPNDELQKKLKNDEEYNLALHIVNSLEEEFQIEIPDIEIAYICLHIKGSKLQYVSEERIEIDGPIHREEILEFINRMIDVYDEELAYELKQDEEFIVGLLAHLQPTFIRLRNHMNISNPLLDQIKENYYDIYEKCLKVGKLIEERFDCNVPEAEIGFLAMHFGAATVRLENQRESKRRVLIGIVCASGIGISRLMLNKLTKFLKDRAEVFTYGKEDLTHNVLSKIDFLISSINLDEIDADIIRVSPLLIEHDLEQIDTKVRIYSKTPKKKMVENDFSRQLEQVNFIVSQIKNMINEFECIKVNNDITFEELLVALTEKLSPYNDKRIIIQEDIKKREKIATQIIPEFDFALLHSKTKGVIKPSFSICITKDLEAFYDPYFKSIHAIIVMLLPDDENVDLNREILGYLSSSLVENNDFLPTIFTGDKEEILSFLTKLLKNFFNQFIDTI
ncbi:mannitol operon transcriptional antiterminator [Mobilisporobacter senegalensis]|uniref:Mannitol operon transcriptional antiterminator n=1 Tax=Mobilisporobacter senegalensis TaxID=1329262 RepID=A0A3N1XUY0_9FIRM|nr:BglG family transcription antiterminator [Mobilisporobacter senegalensis]ROR30435.1 mannitol operon transcriptional antiterminator [Mobilisporobacter senegalensis]